LTNDILDFARIESGTLALDPQPTDPRACVEEALDLFAPRAEEKKLALLHHCAPDVPAAVVIDAVRLRQILVNLVNNAVKFTPAGEIELRLALAATPAPAGHVALEFSVRDTGPGIAAADREKIFRPFTQLDATSTRQHGGAGLGLAICRHLAHHLGGAVRLDSEPGRGSVFTLALPAPVSLPAPPPPDLGGQRIALVGAPDPLRRELTALLEQWRAQVIPLATAAELRPTACDLALVALGTTEARQLAATPLAPPAFPAARALALVPLALPGELRTALRPHFHRLVNTPVHHGALFGLLTGVRPVAPRPGPGATHLGLRVLLVDDNPVNQRLMEKTLARLGCAWRTAENGRVALATLAADPAFDLLLLDLHMPVLDGHGVIEHLRSGAAGPRHQKIWIAALTADARPEQRERTLAAGADDYLTKPLQLPDLEAALHRFRARAPQ
ncbi:MAG: hypothetical protein RLZZ15_2420, partial [Verrucomicrobiota bacterium]